MGRMVEHTWGDLAPHPDCPEKWRPAADWFMGAFQVDAKRRRSFSLDTVLRCAAHPFWLWSRKLREDTASGKVPIMVLTAPGGRAVAAYDSAFAGRLVEAYGPPRFAVAEIRNAGRCAVFAPFDAWVKGLGSPKALGCP